jgi:hypothetical protein
MSYVLFETGIEEIEVNYIVDVGLRMVFSPPTLNSQLVASHISGRWFPFPSDKRGLRALNIINFSIHHHNIWHDSPHGSNNTKRTHTKDETLQHTFCCVSFFPSHPWHGCQKWTQEKARIIWCFSEEQCSADCGESEALQAELWHR